MGYTEKEWKRRIAERTDMSTSLIHLTRELNDEKVSNTIDILYKILKEKKLNGSTTTSGFICGHNKAVCFQDSPLSSINQNVFYEQKKRENGEESKVRYRPVGLLFDKSYSFNKGARPVIYDKTEDAKKYLPESEWWRIVNLNLENKESIIDWSHEREWRVKGDFDFELSEVTILIVSQHWLKKLLDKFKEDKIDLMNEIKGVVTLEHLLY